MRLGLEPPIVNCSGILSYVDVFELWESMGVEMGGWITKSFGLNERDGNENVTVYGLDNGAINSMGLSNPGVGKGKGLDELRDVRLKKPPIASVIGFSPYEYREVVRVMEETVPGIAAYEVNPSCPNKTPGETSLADSIGDSPDLVYNTMSGVRKATKKPVILKISPRCDVKSVAKAAEKAGADYIGCANTMPALVLNKRGKPVLAGGSGGLSGPALKPINMKVVYDVYEVINPERTGIIAYGGIEAVDDILDYCRAGAEIFGLGTVFKYMNTDDAIGLTNGLVQQLYIRLSRMGTTLKELEGAAHG